MADLGRREFLGASMAGIMAQAPMLGADAKGLPKGKAQACIFLWLGGGACQIDTWDPKRRGDGKKVAGSYYDAIPTAIAGAKVCSPLARSAPLLDRAVLLRSVHHDVIDEHAAAVNRMHTGRPITGAITYPSIGSLVTHELGPARDGVPPYIVIGYPNVTRGPGFLGADHGYLYLTETKAGPAGLTAPADVSPQRQSRRESLRARIGSAKPTGDDPIASYATVSSSAFALARSSFKSVFDLDREPADLRNAYGGEFGQRCLLARRLVQTGVKFVEVSFNLNFVNGTGWDTHNEGQLKQHVLIEQLDQAFATLLVDLEKHRMLDSTLVVISTEFGRPPEFDAGGGRGHQSKAFSVVLAGGGLRTGRTIGVTDDLGKKIVERPVSVPDLFATLFCSFGIDPAKELYADTRPVPITDRGVPLAELFA